MKIENTYSAWMEIAFGVKHGSILRPLLFKTFLANLFFIISNIEIASYTDDNTPYIAADNIDDLIKSLEDESTALFQWLGNNLLKNKSGECHLIISSNENITVKLANMRLKIVSVRNYLESN